MINQENLNKLYDGALETTHFTTKQLKEYGFHSKDLIEKGVIERLERGIYQLKNIDQLFNYGKHLIAQK